MRNLQTGDVFNALRLAKAIGVENIINKLKNVKDTDEAGMLLIEELLTGLSNPQAESYFYKLMAGVLEKNENEIKEMNPMDLIKSVKELSTIITGDDWKSFFVSVSHLMH